VHSRYPFGALTRATTPPACFLHKCAAKTREERQRLMNEMGAYRQKHRRKT
jgi:hypothetical protein